MSEEHPAPEAGTPTTAADQLPENLPPVEPPSAGFIIQLFVIPALIVAAVIGVVSIPRLLVRSQQDWRQLVSELDNANEHRRWRAALNLAQVLRADEELGKQGQQLSRNPEIATALANLVETELEQNSHDADQVRQQAFVVRTLGFLDVPETTIPALRDAMTPQHDLDIRRNAIASLSLIAGRADERGEPLHDEELVEALCAATGDAAPPIRHLAAFTLGLLPGEQSRRQLTVLVDNERLDRDTRVNAAVGLARQQSAAGLPLFCDVLREAADDRRSEEVAAKPGQFEQFVTVRNSIKAVGLLASGLPAAERTELAELLKPLAAAYPESRIRLDAQDVLHQLNAVE